ncbi:DnaT-like ssDNA-binding protein [Inquilinus sp. OTU3971]|uniref:DnaT-like ssDNA-binding protein n=1 Tax=Inquilinus sp. OTU3971 TaxID=3043855 RepID=UPI00313C01E4
MTVTVGTNSYISAADATAYFADRLYAAEWTAASSGDKDKALIMAARQIDRLAFLGQIATAGQAMAWPRTGVTDREGRTISSTTVPQAVKDAQCEVALATLRDDPTADDGNRNVRRLKAGSVELEYSGAAPTRVLPDIAASILAPFLEANSAHSVRLVP